VTVALVLAILTAARIGSSGISWRKQPNYVSYSQILVTQHGFPWGRLGVTTQPGSSAAAASAAKGSSDQVADPGRLTSLAIIYSQLVTSDVIHRAMQRYHPPLGQLEAAPLLDSTGQDALPIVSIAGFSNSAKHAEQLAGAAQKALVGYVIAQQDANAIPPKDRADLSVIVHADHAKLVKGRSITMSLLVFIAVVGATIAFAFALENARRRPGEVAPAARRVA
jgi:hypothetical protein